MEYLVFGGAIVAIGVYVLWSRQRRIGSDLDARRQGLPDDLRDKNTGLGSLPNDGRPWPGGSGPAGGIGGGGTSG
jgi:hypothetical protein